MKEVWRVVLGTAFIAGGLMLAGCQSADIGDKNGSYGTASPTQTPSGPDKSNGTNSTDSSSGGPNGAGHTP
jgi:hypothetical protein